jgi:hypothetical protein
MARLSEQDQQTALELLWALMDPQSHMDQRNDPVLKLWVEKCDAFFKKLKPWEMRAPGLPGGKKITVHFKTPDAVDAAIFDATGTEVHGNPTEEQQEIKDALGKFIQYGESVQIEFDIEAGTATVVPL